MEKQDILLDLAVGLYVSKRLPLGQAANMAGLSQGDFQQQLGLRQITAHYDLDDLADDLGAGSELSRP